MGLKLWCHRRSCSTCNTDFYFDGQLTPVSLDSLVPLVIIIIPSVNSTMVKWGRVNTLLHCSNSLEVWNKFRKTTTKTKNVSGFLAFFDPHSKCALFPIMSVWRTGARKQRGLQCEKEVIMEELLWHCSFKRGNSSYIYISVSHTQTHTDTPMYLHVCICKCNYINEMILFI